MVGVNEELAARRRGQDGRPDSLRALSDYFNQAVVRQALERAGGNPLSGEVENTYRLLTDDDVSSGTRIRARKRLEGDGIDVEAVEGGFVSHPTIGKHLRECLGIEGSADTRDRVESATERIFKLQSRAEAVIVKTLEELASADRVSAGELAVTVDTQVMCEVCETHLDVGRFIERGGCDCEDNGD